MATMRTREVTFKKIQKNKSVVSGRPDKSTVSDSEESCSMNCRVSFISNTFSSFTVAHSSALND